MKLIKIFEFVVNKLKSKLETVKAKQFHDELVEWDRKRNLTNSQETTQ